MHNIIFKKNETPLPPAVFRKVLAVLNFSIGTKFTIVKDTITIKNQKTYDLIEHEL